MNKTCIFTSTHIRMPLHESATALRVAARNLRSELRIGKRIDFRCKQRQQPRLRHNALRKLAERYFSIAISVHQRAFVREARGLIGRELNECADRLAHVREFGLLEVAAGVDIIPVKGGKEAWSVNACRFGGYDCSRMTEFEARNKRAEAIRTCQSRGEVCPRPCLRREPRGTRTPGRARMVHASEEKIVE